MQLFCRTALLALSAATLLGLPRTALAQPEAGAIQPSLAGKAEHRHGRLDSILNDVVAAYERTLDSASESQSAAGERAAAQAAAQDAASRMAARRAPMRLGPSVAVTLRIEDASKIEAIARFLEDNGGDPRNLGEDYIEAYVPVRLLVAASKQPGVFRVQAIIPPQPKREPIVSQGVAAHGASLWHALGVTGKGVKVGVIDTGFSGLRRLIGSELPAPVAARCYKSMGESSSQLSDCGNEGNVHGTAVAEALLDIAPDVSLYIADPVSRGDLARTVDWMVEQSVQVINYSVGWLWDGPGDGTSPHSESPLNTVDVAVRRGIVWVNAAGNEGQSAWFGRFRDEDGDNFHDFGYMQNSREPWECIPLSVVSKDTDFLVLLRWQGRWLTNDRLADIDLLLYDMLSLEMPSLREVEPVEASKEFQNYYNAANPGSRMPYEGLMYEAKQGKTYCLSVKRKTGYAYDTPYPSWIQLLEFNGIPFTNGRTFFHTPWGSITNPAESANPGLLAVGAAPWNRTRSIEEYSSRGPTPDRRIKPDIVGVDMAYSSSYRTRDNLSGAFPGTSQASPHVAGLAALVRSAYPHYTPAQVAGYLKSSAEPRRIRDPYYDRYLDPNNIWGYGLARLLPISIQYRERIQSEEGSRQVPLSRYFPTADDYTRFTASSSNPELVRVEIRQGRLIFAPAQDGEGQATITLTARFRNGLRATVRIVLTVEGALLWPRSFSGWRLGQLKPPVSTTTPFQDAFIE